MALKIFYCTSITSNQEDDVWMPWPDIRQGVSDKEEAGRRREDGRYEKNFRKFL